MVGGFLGPIILYVQCNAFLNTFPQTISEWIYNYKGGKKHHYNYSPLNDCPPTIYETFQKVQRFMPDFYTVVFNPIVTKLCLSMDSLP